MTAILNSSWLADVSGAYQVAANWAPALVPTYHAPIEYWATIGGGATAGASAFTVTSSASETLGNLTLGANATLTIAAGIFRIASAARPYSVAYNYGVLDIASGATLAIGLAGGPAADTGELQNVGAVNLNGGALTIAAPAFSLKGAGRMTLTAGKIAGAASGGVASLFNADSTIAGSGEVGIGAGLSLDNAQLGIIDANASAALILNTGANAIQNSGTIETTGAGGLVLESAMHLDGQLTAAGTGALKLMKGAVVTGGGDVDIDGAGAIALDQGALDLSGVIAIAAQAKITTMKGNTNAVGANGAIAGDALVDSDIEDAGLIVVANDSTLNLNAAVYGAGAIDLEGSTGPTKLEIFGEASLHETGGLILTNCAQNAIAGNGAGADLDNYTAISGAGTLGDAWLRLNNLPTGVIDSVGGAGMTILADAAAVAAGAESEDYNGGTIETTGAGGLAMTGGTFDNAGYLQAAGAGALTMVDEQLDNGDGVVETLGSGRIVLARNSVIANQALVSVSAGGSLATTAGDTDDAITTNVSNSGKINVVAGSTLAAAGAWRGAGSVTIAGTSAAAIAIQAGQGWTLEGGGAIILSGADAAIVSRGAGTSLYNMNDVIAGLGEIGDANMRIDNFKSGIINATGTTGLVLDAAAYDAGTGQTFVYNAGTMESHSLGGLTIEAAMYSPGKLIATTAGDIDAQAAVYGAGTATINGTGSIEFGDIDQNDARFAGGAAGALILDQSALFSGEVWGFAAGDSIDLRDFAYNAATTRLDATTSGFSALEGSLYVTNGTADSAPIYLEGDYLAAHLSASDLAFQCSADGHEIGATGVNGTLITLAATH